MKQRRCLYPWLPERRPRAPWYCSSHDRLLLHSLRRVHLQRYSTKVLSWLERHLLRLLLGSLQTLKFAGRGGIDVPVVGRVLWQPRCRARGGAGLALRGTWRRLILNNRRAQMRVCVLLLRLGVCVLRRRSQIVLRAGGRRLKCALRDVLAGSRCPRRGLTV